MHQIDHFDPIRDSRLRKKWKEMIRLEYVSLYDQSKFQKTGKETIPNLQFHEEKRHVEYDNNQLLNSNRSRDTVIRHIGYKKCLTIIKAALRRKVVYGSIDMKASFEFLNSPIESYQEAIQTSKAFGSLLIQEPSIERIIRNKMDLTDENLWIYPLLIVFYKFWRIKISEIPTNIHPILDKLIEHKQIQNWLGKSAYAHYFVTFDAKRAVSLCYSLARSIQNLHPKLEIPIEMVDNYLAEKEVARIDISYKDLPGFQKPIVHLYVKILLPDFPPIICLQRFVRKDKVVNDSNQIRLLGDLDLIINIISIKGYNNEQSLESRIIKFTLFDQFHTNERYTVSPYTFHELLLYVPKWEKMIEVLYSDDHIQMKIF
jgi:hypothetical protein